MEILIIALLILLNGLFSMSEIALVSSRRFKLESAAKKGNKNAVKALELSESPNTFLSTVQIGITLIGILTGIYSGQSLTTDLALRFGRIDMLAPYADSIATVSIVLSITYLTIVFGELIPKRLGLSAPEKISSAVAIPMSILSIIAKPVVWLLAKTNDFFLGLLGIKENQEGTVTEEEIKAMTRQSTKSGEILLIEQELVSRVFSLGDRKARELMTHRNDLVWINITDTYDEMRAKTSSSPHSNYPVCEGSLDKVLGIVSLKQLFQDKVEPRQGFDLQHYLQKALYVHENMAAYRVLEQFKSNRLHHALVVDEYGDVQGMITMSDIMDELVSSTFEEGGNEQQIIKRADDSWLVDGQFPYFELLEYLNVQEVEASDGFTTVAGLVLSKTDHIPKAGESVRWNHYELEVVDMDGHRIDKVLITKK